MMSAKFLLALALPLEHCIALVPSPPQHAPLQKAFSFQRSSRSRESAGDGFPLPSAAGRYSSTALHARTRRRRRRRRVRHGVDRDQDLEDCVYLDRGDIDHQGLAKSIDAEYAIEEAKLGLSFWEVLERERARKPEDISEKSRDMSAWARAKRRMTYARGDTESKYTLMADRSYGEPDLLDQDHLVNAPSLDDLNQRPAKFKDVYWSSPIFRVGVVAISYFSFPLFLKFWYLFQTIDPDDFDVVVGQIAPNVGVLYATILALTLQVLYERFTKIQEHVATEAMLLSQVTRNLLSLFAKEPEWAVESCQMVANQVRMMLSRTRGVELLSIMKADTYANLLAIVDDYHYLHGCDDDYTAQEESITSMLRLEIAQLMEVRALRLSDEASSLPPTHFTLITSLSVVSIVAYVTASLKVVEDLWHPPQEASLLFAALMALYILFFNFCRDINGPFAGVYQIKRSNAVSHLMQTKWLITNQLGDAVSFKQNFDTNTAETEDIATVDANAMLSLVDELESRVETIQQEEDLCEAADEETISLDCIDDDRESRLFQMKEELARLRLLNQAVATATPDLDPESRLHRMEAELDKLKQLKRQLDNVVHVPSGHINDDVQVSAGHIDHGASTHIGVPALDTGIDISAAQAALDQASLEAAAARKSLTEATKVNGQVELLQSKSQLLADKAIGIPFDHKLEDGLYLAGVGVRKKAIIKVYHVGMYCSSSALEALSPTSAGKDAQTALWNAVRRFDASSPTASFILRMVLKADAQTISGAIADSVKPRYDGSASDVERLEALIFEGVKSKGGHATKGTMLQFVCSKEGVSVSVDGKPQGMAMFEGMGSAFVDVFLDEKAVSQSLVDSCLDTWCGSGIHQDTERLSALTKRFDEARLKENEARKVVYDLQKAKQLENRKEAEREVAKMNDHELLEQAEELFKEEQIKMAEEEEKRRAEEEARRASEEEQQRITAFETMMTPLKDKATGVEFDAKLEDRLYLVGVGVRKKAIINVYAVALYSSISAIEALSPFPRNKQKKDSQAALCNAARTFTPSSPTTTLVLEMVFKADAQTIAGAIAEGVKPRYRGPASDVKELESLIINGVKSKGGQATKGTVFRFECTGEGVGVSVDGNLQGVANFEGMGSAFVDVFTDSNAVSPQLVDSCLNTWCGSKSI
mmetsp:Transcript_10705/g.22994  ORF Transcript_10705/g.22994 Transcript_10705/m.22994 type:complete len:1161 (+) Transcript_10705:103-3585(+)